MQISDKDLDDFIRRWEKALGERLTRDQAAFEANKLLTFYRGLAEFAAKDPKPPSEPASDQTSAPAS